MTIDELLNMWDIDAKTGAHQIASAALDIPVLHSKYLRIYTAEKLRLNKLQQNNVTMRANKRQWMLGELTKDELDELHWKPWLRATPLKGQLDEFISEDQDCMRLNDCIRLQEEKVAALNSILNIISNRSFQLNTAVNFLKFQNGA